MCYAKCIVEITFSPGLFNRQTKFRIYSGGIYKNQKLYWDYEDIICFCLFLQIRLLNHYHFCSLGEVPFALHYPQCTLPIYIATYLFGIFWYDQNLASLFQKAPIMNIHCHMHKAPNRRKKLRHFQKGSRKMLGCFHLTYI